MFVEYNEIRDIVGTASFRKILDDIISPVNPVRIGKYQAHLLRQMRVNPPKKWNNRYRPPYLCKLQQLRARVPRCGQNDLRIYYSRSRILAIDVRGWFYILYSRLESARRNEVG